MFRTVNYILQYRVMELELQHQEAASSLTVSIIDDSTLGIVNVLSMVLHFV